MKNYLRVAVGVSLFSFIVSSVGAVTYPSSTPGGETASGAFNTYFYNMYSNTGTTDIVLDYTKGCPEGQVIRGFSTGGILYCINSVTSGLTGSIVGIDKYVPRYTTAGTGLTISQIYDSGAGVIIGYGTGASSSTNNTRLTLSGGDLDIDGIRVGKGSGAYTTILGQTTFASNGLQNTILGYYAGYNLSTGDNNIAIGFNTALKDPNGSNQLNIGNIIFGSGVTGYTGSGSIGIGTNTPGAKLEIDSGIDKVSGLRFTRVTQATSEYALGPTKPIGVTASGDVVAMVPLSNIAVYDGLEPIGFSGLDPDAANHKLSYDFNNYFKIYTVTNAKQSFVLSDGLAFPKNGPYIQENGTGGSVCSGNGSPYTCSNPDPVTNEFASPKNSFTITAKGNNYGYQLALGVRGDAPLFARSGKFDGINYASGLFLQDSTTEPAPWQKVISVPANHVEYFYINTGYSSQLKTQSGGGEVGIGTSFPHSRFEVWTGASTASLLHFRGSRNVALGESALGATFYTGFTAPSTTYTDTIGLGYGAGSGLTSGSNNIFIGANTNGASNPSNFLNIGNLLYGNNIGLSTGKIGIGTATPAKQLTITESMEMPDTSSSTMGVLYKNSARFLHNFTGTGFNTNTFLGINSGNFNLANIGYGNTGIGTDTLLSITTGFVNTAVGEVALRSTTSGGYNTAIGRGSLYNNTTGAFNTANGVSTLYKNSSGINNSAFGREVLYNNTIGNGNTAFGMQAGYTVGTGSFNTLLGYRAGFSFSSGTNNIAIGYETQFSSLTGSNQLNIGNLIYGTGLVGALAGNIGIGISNPAYKLEVAGTGSFSAIQIATGAGTGKVLTSDNFGNGTWTDNPPSTTEWSKIGNDLTFSSTGFLGTTSGHDLIIKTAGQERLRVLQNGNLSLSGMTIGRGNNNVPGNTALGLSALTNVGAGVNYNTAIGNGSLSSNTGGWDNTAIGNAALPANTIGMYNTAIGSNAMINNTGGNNNTALGVQALAMNRTGQSNVAVGAKALFSNISGNDNVAIGRIALSGSTGNNNVALGNYAGSGITSGSRNIAIGHNAQVLSATSSDQLSIGNWIYGNNGNIGIGLGSTPSTNTLSLSGSFKYTDGSQGSGNILVSDQFGVARWGPAPTGLFAWELDGNTGSLLDFIGTTASFPLVFKTDNAERMRITATGQLALGTTNPGSYKFYNNGTTYLGGQVDVMPVQSIYFLNPVATGTTAGIRWLFSSDNASLYVSEVTPDQTDFTFKLGDNTTGDRFVWRIDDWTGATVYPMLLAGNYGNFYSGAMYINNSNYTNPLVGFGTNSPTAKVDINGNIRIRGTGAVTGGQVLVAINSNGDAQWQDLNSNSGVLNSWTLLGNSGTVAGTNFIGTQDNQDFVIKTNNIERLRVLTDGNLSLSGGFTIGRGNNNISSNIALGNALKNNTTGYYNTAIGYNALYTNTGGYQNTAIGVSTLQANTTGYDNSANGMNVLFNNTTGNSNTANGIKSLYNNTSGSNNSAFGKEALYANISGINNSALGVYAGYNIVTGNNNTLIGYLAGFNSTGSNNIAIGVATNLAMTGGSNQLNIGNVIYGSDLTGNGSGNIGIGVTVPTAKLEVAGQIKITGGGPVNGYVLTTDATGLAVWSGAVAPTTEWTRVGNAGTSSATNFIGTTDNVDLVIRTNNQERLRVLTNGNLSLSGGFTIGYGSGGSSIISNTAFGINALKDTTGWSNTAMGYNALKSNTTGNFNTANGHSALQSNTSGFNNTANGLSALYMNTTGYNNVAYGVNALYSNTGGSHNTAYGVSSLMGNIIGNNNVAMGYRSLSGNTIGNNNLALGTYAGSDITSGTNNIAIGYNAQVPSAISNNQLSIGNWIYGSGGNIGIGSGMTIPTHTLSLSGSLKFTDGKQGTGVYLRGYPDGTAYWYSPKDDQTIFVASMSAGENVTPSSPIKPLGLLITKPLPVGLYKFEFIGRFSSATASANLGLSLYTSGSTVDKFISEIFIQETNSSRYTGYSHSITDIKYSNGNPNSGSFPGTMKGTFKVTATGSIGVQINAQIQDFAVEEGSTLIIQSLKPELYSNGV